jgi:outer membrane immunogenic protein
VLLELGAVVLGGVLRAAIGMVDAIPGRLPAGDSRPECRQGQPCIDTPADGIAHDTSRPGIENGRQIDEADSINGFIAGGTIGGNLQLGGRWLVGIDLSFSDISGSFGPGNLGQPNGGGWNCASGPCRTEVEWFGTLRGRVGPTFGRTLVYATGGLAFGHLKAGIDNSLTFQTDHTNVGWTVGGGIEHMLHSNWSAKIEYLHVDLGWTSVSNGFFKADAEFDLVRAGLNYRFGH